MARRQGPLPSLSHPFLLKPGHLSCWKSFRSNFHLKSLLLTILMYLNLAAISWCQLASTERKVHHVRGVLVEVQKGPCEDGYVFIPLSFAVVIYVLYLIEAYHCTVRQNLRKKVSYRSVYELIAQMKLALPIVWWRVLCYHYTRRSRQVTSYRNGDSYTTTQDYYERVNTNTALAAFDFSLSGGVTDCTKPVTNLEKFPITKVTFAKSFGFARVEAENDYLSQRSRFFDENELKDEYIETQEGMNLTDVEFIDSMVVFQDKESLPWYVSQAGFVLLTLMTLSWPYRILIGFKTAHVHCTIEKVFGSVPPNLITSSPSPHIANETTITPSSEQDTRTSGEIMRQSPIEVSDVTIASNGATMYSVPCVEEGRTNTPTTSSNLGVAERLGTTEEGTNLLPSYSEVMLYDCMINKKYACKSTQVSPSGSFGHVTEVLDDGSVIACLHQAHERLTLNLANVQLSRRYNFNGLYRHKCRTYTENMNRLATASEAAADDPMLSPSSNLPNQQTSSYSRPLKAPARRSSLVKNFLKMPKSHTSLSLRNCDINVERLVNNLDNSSISEDSI